jgi:hypothetical protein
MFDVAPDPRSGGPVRKRRPVPAAPGSPASAGRRRHHRSLAAQALALLVGLGLGACSERAPAVPRPPIVPTDLGVDARPGDGDGGADPGARDADVTGRDLGPPLPMCTAPIDVVFVIDVSTSMADELGRIRDGVASIWSAATALTPDSRFSLVVFVDDATAEAGCAPFASVAAMQSAFDRWRAFCSTNRQTSGGGSNTDCTENSLDALYLAATACPWRPGATRIAIHVTDDTFAERPTVLSDDFFGGGYPVMRTYAETVDALRAAEVRVGAFAAPGAGEECGAGSSPDVGRGFHAPYRGMPSIPDATGGRVWSIRDVRAGSLDMATAINEMVRAEYCTLY